MLGRRPPHLCHDGNAGDSEQTMVLELAFSLVAQRRIDVDNQIVIFPQHDTLEQAAPYGAEVEFKAGNTVADRGRWTDAGRIARPLVMQLRGYIAGRKLGRVPGGRHAGLLASGRLSQLICSKAVGRLSERIDLTMGQREVVVVRAAHEGGHFTAALIRVIGHLIRFSQIRQEQVGVAFLHPFERRRMLLEGFGRVDPSLYFLRQMGCILGKYGTHHAVRVERFLGGHGVDFLRPHFDRNVAPLDRHIAAIHDCHIQKTERVVGPSDNVLGARPRNLRRLGVRYGRAVHDLIEFVGERAYHERVGHHERGSRGDPRSGGQAFPAGKCKRDLDEAVAGVIEVAPADRLVVVQPGWRRRFDREQRWWQRLVLKWRLAPRPCVGARFDFVVVPGALCRVVDCAGRCNVRILLFQLGAIDQSVRRRKTQADARKPGVRLDVADVAEVHELVGGNEVLAFALQRLRLMAGEPLRFRSDRIVGVVGASNDLAVRDHDAPGNVGWTQPELLQQVQAQRHQLVLTGQRKDLEKRRHRPDVPVLLECHSLRNPRFRDFAAGLVDDERCGRLDLAIAQPEPTVGIDFDRVVVDWLSCGPKPGKCHGWKYAQFENRHWRNPPSEIRAQASTCQTA